MGAHELRSRWGHGTATVSGPAGEASLQMEREKDTNREEKRDNAGNTPIPASGSPLPLGSKKFTPLCPHNKCLLL